MSHHESDKSHDQPDDQPHDVPIPGSREADAPSGPSHAEDNAAAKDPKSPEDETEQLPDLDN